MGLVSLLFSFNGRINRLQYWLGCVLVVVLGFLGFFLAFTLAGASITNQKTPDVAGVLGALGLMVPVWLLMVWCSLAIQVKRFHDRGRSGYWSLLPMGVMTAMIFAGISAAVGGAPPEAAAAAVQPLSLVLWLINLGFFIDLGCLGSKEGPNKYGDPPGAPRTTGSLPTPSKPLPEAPSIPGIKLAGAQDAIDRAIEERKRAAQAAQSAALQRSAAAAAGAAPSFGRRSAR